MAKVAVCVLGDVGRSPRMQYHALSTATCEDVGEVLLVGYEGEKCIPAIENNNRVRQWRFRATNVPSFVPGILALVIKAISTSLHMSYGLLSNRPHVILLQNPPCVPSMLASLLCMMLCGSVVCVDWHNLGFTMVQHKYNCSNKHPLVVVARMLERFLTSIADRHICVTFAMREWLRTNFNIYSTCVHDKPPQQFSYVSIEDRHTLLKKLNFTDDRFGWGDVHATGTIQTYIDHEGNVRLREDRAGIVVSSTSWTPDEDFSIFLDAIQMFDEWLRRHQPTTRVLFAVTGKGPLRTLYEQKFQTMKLTNTACVCVWLEPEDYPRMIGCADVGTCMHTSTSGIDLPMKVLDMLGCGIAVCALDFPAMPELIVHQSNGLVFANAEELVDRLCLLYDGFPDPAKPWKRQLDKYQQAARSTTRWNDEWDANMRPVINHMVQLANSRAGWMQIVWVVAIAAFIGLFAGLMKHAY